MRRAVGLVDEPARGNEFLRARVHQLEEALTEAALSLDTAAKWPSGDNAENDLWPWLRSRATVARRVLEESPRRRTQFDCIRCGAQDVGPTFGGYCVACDRAVADGAPDELPKGGA